MTMVMAFGDVDDGGDGYGNGNKYDDGVWPTILVDWRSVW